MPKKTKKQKLASERRKLQFSQKIQAQPISISQPTIKKMETITSTQTIRPIQTQTDTITTKMFKKDLTKSLVISGAILCIVFGIYLQQQFGILPINSLFN